MKADLHGKPLLDVLKGERPVRRPIWFMRQAGRYLPEYRKLRERAGSFLDLCYQPELAAEVTLQPLRRYDLDAAIIFADILVVPHAMGLSLRFEEGEGPILETVRTYEQVKSLKALGEASQVQAVCETIARVKASLENSVALIGFCGGPWTVASYMIEGGSSNRELARAAAARGERWFRHLIERLVEESAEYLSRQIEAGAEAVQIFDSWAGDLTDGPRKEFVEKPLAAVVKRFCARHPQMPVIVFARGVAEGHRAIQEATGAEAMGIESEFPIEQARDLLIDVCAVQGNLDPVILLEHEANVRKAAADLAAAMPFDRHIFNLGHGVRPQTKPEMLTTVIDAVRSLDGR
ncbi:MAG: uroporphyrinogen decarboxylase [Methylocella sp.]